MAIQRNNLARLPWPVREVACRVMFDGGGNDEVGRAVAEACGRENIPAPAIHGTTILAYRKSDEYRRYCDSRRSYQTEQETARSLWAAISADGGATSAVQAARYLALREIVGQLQAGELGPGDVAKLTRSLAQVSANDLAEAKREWQAERAAIETEHAQALAALEARLAQANAEIAKLRGCLAEHKIDPDQVKTTDGGLSDETLRQIEERAKLL